MNCVNPGSARQTSERDGAPRAASSRDSSWSHGASDSGESSIATPVIAHGEAATRARANACTARRTGDKTCRRIALSGHNRRARLLMGFLFVCILQLQCDSSSVGLLQVVRRGASRRRGHPTIVQYQDSLRSEMRQYHPLVRRDCGRMDAGAGFLRLGVPLLVSSGDVLRFGLLRGWTKRQHSRYSIKVTHHADAPSTVKRLSRANQIAR